MRSFTVLALKILVSFRENGGDVGAEVISSKQVKVTSEQQKINCQKRN